jgi:hypothetical protein
LCLIKLNDKDYFDAVFDILNDDDYDHGSNEGRPMDTNQQQLETILEEYFEDFDFDHIDTNVDEEEMFTVTEDEATMTNDVDDVYVNKVMNNEQS